MFQRSSKKCMPSNEHSVYSTVTPNKCYCSYHCHQYHLTTVYYTWAFTRSQVLKFAELFPFIHLCRENACYVLGIILDSRSIVVNTTDIASALVEVISSEKNRQWTTSHQCFYLEKSLPFYRLVAWSGWKDWGLGAQPLSPPLLASFLILPNHEVNAHRIPHLRLGPITFLDLPLEMPFSPAPSVPQGMLLDPEIPLGCFGTEE